MEPYNFQGLGANQTPLQHHIQLQQSSQQPCATTGIVTSNLHPKQTKPDRHSKSVCEFQRWGFQSVLNRLQHSH